MTELEQAEPISEDELRAIEEQREAEEKERMSRLDSLAAGLTATLGRDIGLRQQIEERWLKDLRQYNGNYEPTTLANIRAKKGSELFVNITRPKCSTAEARLGDLLFPTDDKNWALSPTPVPKLSAAMDDPRPAVDPATGEQVTVADGAKRIQEEAKKKCAAMELEIEDQLREAHYNAECRKVIHDAVLSGTGVLCGPIVVGETRRAWKRVGEDYQLTQVDEIRPEVRRVNYWNFFPDSDAATIDDVRYVFERRHLHQQGMMELLDDPYYLTPQLIRAIKAGPRASTVADRHPTTEQRDNSYSGNDERGEGAAPTNQEVFEVWTYHGPVKVTELRAAGVEVDNPDDPISAELGDDAEVSACVVFCNDIVIKAYLNPLDSGELPYSVFNYEKDEASPFGYGVPYRMRNQQAALNAAWRALMDNTGLTVLPNYIVNKGLVQPMDGDWSLSSGKGWDLTDRNRSVNEVMAMLQIPSHQAELQQIIELSRRFIDDETNLPLITQGDQGSHITQTAQGMSMLMNAANVVTRHIVKNWDDGVTTPTLRRFYDWNMQYSDREDIKGDYEVDARGATVMMARELQSQNLMAVAQQFAGHPVFGMHIKEDGLIRKVIQTLNLPIDDVLLTEDEVKARQDQMRQQQQGGDPTVQLEQMKIEFEREKLQAEMQREQMVTQARLHQAQMENETALIRLATERDLTIEQLRGQLAQTRIKEEGAQARLMQEAQIKATFGSGI